MPRGVYERTIPVWNKGKKCVPMSEEQKQKISQHHKESGVGKWMTGKKRSEEIKQKMSESMKKSGLHEGNFKKGLAPWNKGLVGFNKGHEVLEETKIKIGNANRGKRRSHEQLVAFSISRTGTTWSEARRKTQENYAAKAKTKPIRSNNKDYDPNWNEIRKEIYKRDNWVCAECGCKCKNVLDKSAKCRIQCHHIDYNEKNNESTNLITLCVSCHAKTWHTKKYWIGYYQNRMLERSV